MRRAELTQQFQIIFRHHAQAQTHYPSHRGERRPPFRASVPLEARTPTQRIITSHSQTNAKLVNLHCTLAKERHSARSK